MNALLIAQIDNLFMMIETKAERQRNQRRCSTAAIRNLVNSMNDEAVEHSAESAFRIIGPMKVGSVIFRALWRHQMSFAFSENNGIAMPPGLSLRVLSK